jgi:hypothetical protein
MLQEFHMFNGFFQYGDPPHHSLVRGVNLNQSFYMLGIDGFPLFFLGSNLGLIRDQLGSNKGFFFFKWAQPCVGSIGFGLDVLQFVLFGRNVFQNFLQVRSSFGVQLRGLPQK